MKTISSSEFKAKCLAILDDVQRTGEEITILKRGRPVARLLPYTATEGKFPQDGLIGSVEVRGDIVSPALPPDTWEAESGRP